MSIRNSAKALIVRDGQILLNQCKNTISEGFWGLSPGQIYYDLPGGGQDKYEALEAAVARECLEETGYAVTVERLAAIYEEICVGEDLRAKFEAYAHKMHFAFICSIADEARRSITVTDFDTVGPVWMDLAKLDDIVLLPRLVHANLRRVLEGDDGVIFLGTEYVS